MPEAKDTAPVAILAVDGGASKTEVCLVRPDGTVVGWARGDATNHQVVGMDSAMSHLDATIASALETAGVSPNYPCADVGIYCLAGVDLPIDERRVDTAVHDRGWTKSAHVDNDTFALLRAGSPTGRGVAVVCGTGLNCVARGPTGLTVRFPALGELSGDFTPGGMWLGVRGLGLALRAGDGRGPPTLLRDRVAARFESASVEDVLTSVYERTIRFSALAEVAEDVLHASAQDDAPAQSAVDALVDEVVAMVIAAMGRGGFGARDTVPLVVGGGLFSNDRFCSLVVDGVGEQDARAELHRVQDPPVLGAALLGLDALGSDAVTENVLRSSLRTFRHVTEDSD